MPAFRRPVLFLLIAALIVHVGVVVTARREKGDLAGYAMESLDSREFHGLAVSLAASGRFVHPDDESDRPYTWRTPGYPAFLAVFIALLGDSPAMLVGVQQSLSILNVLLVFLVARRHLSRDRSVAAGLFFLIEPYHLFYSLWLLATTLFVTCVLAIWLTWQRTLATGKSRWALALGLICGATVLIRPAATLIPPALLLGLLLSRWKAGTPSGSNGAVRARWAAIVVFIIGWCLPIGGWMLRNFRAAGHFSLSDQGGVVLAYFKSAEVELWRQGRAAERYLETSLNPERRDAPHTVWDAIDRELREKLSSRSDEQRASVNWQVLAQGNRSEIDPFEVSAALRDIGLSRLAAHPLSTATCYLIRCGSILTFPLNLGIRQPVGIEINRWMALGMGWLYLVLCVVALVRRVRGRRSLAHAYYPLAVTVALLLTATPQIDPRFRVPMIPLLVVMALLPRPEAVDRRTKTEPA